MHIEIEELANPPVYRVVKLDGLEKFYKLFGYKSVHLPGLEGEVVRLEYKRTYPILIFKKAEIASTNINGLSINLKFTKSELYKIKMKLRLISNSTSDPNGITINFYT
ncbi:hypothetical protein BH10PAT3_BH10PAT3_6260 [soil metagenome]